MGNEVEIDDATEGAQDATELPAGGAQSRPRQRRPGGKKGARKPSKLLMDMRWCYQNTPKEGESLTPGKTMCRALQKDNPAEFLKRLQDQERAHAAGKPKPVPGSSGTGTNPSGSAGPVPLDKGELTVREMIDKLLKDFSPTAKGSP